MRKVTQTFLASSLRRAGLSGSGLKAEIGAKSSQVGITDPKKIMKLAHMLEEQNGVGTEIQKNASRARIERRCAPNWTKQENFRQFDFIVGARYNNILHRMHQRIETRPELDAGRHDPISQEFFELFNDEDFIPDSPEAYFIPYSPDAVTIIAEDIWLNFEL